MDTNPEIMCRLDGPEVAAFKQACIDNKIWGCFSIMEFNPDGNPYNSGLIIDDHGEIKLYYRKFHPWIPVEPWEPGNIGIPVIEGPKGAKIALIICHDGMFPEMARECAYKGAEIMIRTAGYTAPIRESWRFTNQANAFQNLMVTANVCMCGSDGSFDSMGEGMIVNFDGSIIAHGTTGRADEIITAEVRPDLVREARIHWGVENNIYQLWHRGYVAVKGGAMDCPYTFMQDMVAGTFRLAVGRPGQGDRRHILRLSSAHPDVRTKERQGSRVTQACSPPEPTRANDVAPAFKRSARHRFDARLRAIQPPIFLQAGLKDCLTPLHTTEECRLLFRQSPRCTSFQPSSRISNT